MEDCIFCKIVAGKHTSQKVWEDESYMAFLDLFPICDGQTIVLSKEHQNSYVFDMDDKSFVNLYLAAKKVAKLLDKTLGTSRCVQAMEGLGVNHAHIKLYPLTERMIEGGIIHIGPKADSAKLSQIAKLIKERGDI